MNTSEVLEYKCPCCNAGLSFGSDTQKLTCEYCDNTFDVETVKAYNDMLSQPPQEEFTWDTQSGDEWDASEAESIRAFQCPACGAQIITDDTTAATFCPYCENPAILPSRLSGSIKPDAVLPFQKSKEDAKNAFVSLCKGKPLLPGAFASQNRLEKITGMYVPFWLCDCEAAFRGSYKATRIHKWSDSRYHYTKTDHFLLKRDAGAVFADIPVDGSRKMDDAFMESIEPFDYSQMVPFDMAYLSGYFADKYDVTADSGQSRIRERAEQTIRQELQSSFLGYTTVVPTNRQMQVTHGHAKYVLLPVWMLNTKYNGNIYTFAMNGQTGKMTGTFPVCPKKTAAWFMGICAIATAIAYFVQLLL